MDQKHLIIENKLKTMLEKFGVDNAMKDPNEVEKLR